MDVINTILSVIQVVLAIAVIALVILQPNKQEGLSGAIGGGSDTFFGKNQSKTSEALLNKLTIIGAIAFGVVSLLLNIIK